MNKIRVIDLLNKIANGEELPKKIRFRMYELEYDEEDKKYKRIGNSDETLKCIFQFFYLEKCLNDNVEILDEEDEFIDIEELTCGPYDYTKSTINDLIKNQKKIINKLKEEGK